MFVLNFNIPKWNIPFWKGFDLLNIIWILNFLEYNSFAILHLIINYLYNFKFDSARNEYTKLFS